MAVTEKPDASAVDTTAAGDAKPAKPKGGAGILGVFSPNAAVSGNVMRLLIALQVGVFFAVWLTSPYKALPRPGEVWTALGNLWMNQGLAQELITSFLFNLQALAWSAAISLTLAYLTVLPFFRPVVNAISRGRFLSLVGFSLLFTLLFKEGGAVKLALLVFGMTVYFVTSMASVIAAIPKSDFDYARTLRMSEWRVVGEVVILGTADKAFEVLRQNAAIGWTLLTMVEGIVRSTGGVGVMLLNQNKQFNIPEVFAIQLVILALGLTQDAIIGFLRRTLCPYADLTLERKEA